MDDVTAELQRPSQPSSTGQESGFSAAPPEEVESNSSQTLTAKKKTLREVGIENAGSLTLKDFETMPLGESKPLGENLARNINPEKLNEILDTLPPKMASIFRLHNGGYVNEEGEEAKGLPYSRIAEIHGIPEELAEEMGESASRVIARDILNMKGNSREG